MHNWDEASLLDHATSEQPSEEDLADRYGIRTALLVLCVGLFLAALWAIRNPSFEQCTTLKTEHERLGCYEELRSRLLKPPFKGG
jgi:hypothetical protein